MSNLLDSASIVLTPTAYDNGRMLSVKPNGFRAELVTNGDFARIAIGVKAVVATRVNAQYSLVMVRMLQANSTFSFYYGYRFSVDVSINSGGLKVPRWCT